MWDLTSSLSDVQIYLPGRPLELAARLSWFYTQFNTLLIRLTLPEVEADNDGVNKAFNSITYRLDFLGDFSSPGSVERPNDLPPDSTQRATYTGTMFKEAVRDALKIG